MKQILLSIVFLLSTLECFSQSIVLKAEEFHRLRIEENKWECCSYKAPQGSSKQMDKPSIFENKSSGTQEAADKCKIDIQITRFEFNPSNNQISLEGFIGGGWYGAGSGVEIYVGDSFPKLDTLGPPVNAALKRGANENWPIFTIKTKKLNPSYSTKTAEAKKENSELRPFQINFRIDENDIIVFGLRPCIAEVYDIGNIIKQSPTTE